MTLLLDWLLPHTCIQCGHRSDQPYGLCRACEHTLPRHQITCRRCARTLLSPRLSLCRACLQAPPPFASCTAVGRYTPPFTSWIMQLKYHRSTTHAALLGTLLANAIRAQYSAPPFACILPIPLHTRRLRSRGFNQAQEIGRHLSRQLSTPLNTTLLGRRKHTQTQTHLTAKQRRRNLSGAFYVDERHASRLQSIEHCLLIDDVYTTGSTLIEATRTLHARFPSLQVHVGVIARSC